MVAFLGLKLADLCLFVEGIVRYLSIGDDPSAQRQLDQGHQEARGGPAAAEILA